MDFYELTFVARHFIHECHPVPQFFIVFFVGTCQVGCPRIRIWLQAFSIGALHRFPLRTNLELSNLGGDRSSISVESLHLRLCHRVVKRNLNGIKVDFRAYGVPLLEVLGSCLLIFLLIDFGVELTAIRIEFFASFSGCNKFILGISLIYFIA